MGKKGKIRPNEDYTRGVQSGARITYKMPYGLKMQSFCRFVNNLLFFNSNANEYLQYGFQSLSTHLSVHRQ